MSSFVNVDVPVFQEDTETVYHLVCDGNRFYDTKGSQHTCLGLAPVIKPKDSILGAPHGFQLAGFAVGNAFTYPSTHVINFAANTPFTIHALVGPYPGVDNAIISTDDNNAGWTLDWLSGAARFYVRSAGSAWIAVTNAPPTPGRLDGLNIFTGGYDGTKPVIYVNGRKCITQQVGGMGQSTAPVNLGRRPVAFPCTTTIHEIMVSKRTPTDDLAATYYRSASAVVGLASAL